MCLFIHFDMVCSSVPGCKADNALSGELEKKPWMYCNALCLQNYQLHTIIIINKSLI